MRRVRNQIAPPSGASPMRRKICENRAVSEATIRSQANAMLQPMPTVGAAHRGDHRLLDRMQRAQEGVAAALDLLALGAQSAALHAADIGAGAERAALAGDDDRAHARH